MVVDVGELRLADLHELRRADVPARGRVEERGLRHRAATRRCPRSIYTDAKRLQQVIKNLLSNAFKFTQHGQVTLTRRAGPARAGARTTRTSTARRPVLAFSVTDTGIGIPPDKQQIIFEAFQQADGSTSRKYGGTGLGLAISRELSRLLGGEIRLVSSPGQGQHVHAVPAADLRAARRRRGESPIGSGGRRPAARRRPVLAARRPSAPSAHRPAPTAAELAETPPADQRGRRRPRQHPARRPRAADRRERPRLRPLPAGGGPREGLQGAGHVARRRRPGHDPRVQAATPSRWTSACPTSTAGACWSGSRTT